MSLEFFEQLPLVAILRGVTPKRCIEVAGILFDAGFRCIEVPLNSPQPFKSIQLLTAEFGQKALIGAGTVIDVDSVKQVADVGGQLMVAPNCDVEVIEASKQAGMVAMPGCATPTEMFAALKAGADGIKLFPSGLVSIDVVKAVKEVLPKGTPLVAVGGIDSGNMAAYFQAGCIGFGFGRAVFKPNDDLETIALKAQGLVANYQEIQKMKEIMNDK